MTTKASLRAAIYARKSGDDGTDVSGNKSLQQQLEACKTLCQAQNYNVVGEYAEGGYSGRTYWTGAMAAAVDKSADTYFAQHIRVESKRYRPELGLLMANLESVDVVVVYDKTRLARPALGSLLELYLFQCLREHGVVIHEVAGGLIKPDSSTDQLVQAITSNVADQQLTNSLAKAKAVKANLRENGKLYTGAIGYGYRSSGKQRVEIVDNQAVVVREVFSLFLQGWTVSAITTHLRQQNVPSAEGKQWDYQMVKRLLCRPAYAGLAVGIDASLIKSTVIPSIISEADYHKAQARFSLTKGTSRQNKSAIHPLTGLVHCSSCGGKMDIRHTSTGVVYYQCRSVKMATPNHDDCHLNNVKSSGDGSLEVALMPLCIHGMIKQLQMRLATSSEHTRLVALQNELTAVMQRKAETKAMYVQGILTQVDLADMVGKLTVKEKELTKEKVSIEKKLAKVTGATMDSGLVTAAVLGGLKAEVYRELIMATVKRIEVGKDAVRVHVNGSSFDLPRMKVGKVKTLPTAEITTPERLTADSHIRLTYHTGVAGKAHTVYQSATLSVVLSE